MTCDKLAALLGDAGLLFCAGFGLVTPPKVGTLGACAGSDPIGVSEACNGMVPAIKALLQASMIR